LSTNSNITMVPTEAPTTTTTTSSATITTTTATGNTSVKQTGEPNVSPFGVVVAVLIMLIVILLVLNVLYWAKKSNKCKLSELPYHREIEPTGEITRKSNRPTVKYTKPISL